MVGDEPGQERIDRDVGALVSKLSMTTISLSFFETSVPPSGLFVYRQPLFSDGPGLHWLLITVSCRPLKIRDKAGQEGINRDIGAQGFKAQYDYALPLSLQYGAKGDQMRAERNLDQHGFKAQHDDPFSFALQ